MRLLSRDNGIMMLVALLQRALNASNGSTASIGQRCTTELLRVSRAHVRDLLGHLEAQRHLIRRGDVVRVPLQLCRIFDAYVVETSQRFGHFGAMVQSQAIHRM